MEFLQVPLFDDDVYKMIVRLLINLFFLSILVFVAYLPNNKNRNYVFSFLLMNLTVFFICFTLKKMDLDTGMALGLFAIFSIVRYRTDQIKVKDMTYLFVVIGIAVINSLSGTQTSYMEILLGNGLVIFATWALEMSIMKSKKPDSQSIVYDKIKLIAPERHAELLADIKERTGLVGTRVKVQKVNLAAGNCNIVIYFKNTKGGSVSDINGDDGDD